jgi:hypothetical protein
MILETQVHRHVYLYRAGGTSNIASSSEIAFHHETCKIFATQIIITCNLVIYPLISHEKSADNSIPI